MGRLLLTVFLLISFLTPLHAQDTASTPSTGRQVMSRNVFGEILGPSFGLGVGFDSRFRPGTPFGYRVGIAFTDGSSSSDYDWRSVDFKGVCLPLEANAIFGRRSSKFEVGVGVTPAILHRNDSEGHWSEDSYPTYTYSSGNKLNVLGTINIGYRYQREEGFFMRIGVTAYIGDYKCSPIDGVFVLPGLSLGYTFKY